MVRPELAVLFLFTACAAAPEGVKREAVPEEEKHEQEMRDGEARRRDFQAVLVRLDQAMDSYVQALANRGQVRADQQAERLERTLRETVLDIGAVSNRRAGPAPGENFARLQAAAANGKEKYQQAIAVAALGFSGQASMLDLIVQGALSDDPLLIDRAVLGLAVLKAPDTPPGVLAAIVERPTHPEDGRVQAAWALYEIQSRSNRVPEIVEIWRRFLIAGRDTMPAGVIVSAVRGLGLARDAANAELVVSFLKHTTPRVRMAAAVALARMNAQSHADDLIELLGPQETVQNVRLHARKALADLAGGRDVGYDVAAWRKVFDRGQ